MTIWRSYRQQIRLVRAGLSETSLYKLLLRDGESFAHITLNNSYQSGIDRNCLLCVSQSAHDGHAPIDVQSSVMFTAKLINFIVFWVSIKLLMMYRFIDIAIESISETAPSVRSVIAR